MGAYFSKSNRISEMNESLEIVDKTCNNRDMIATSTYVNNHSPMSVSREYEYLNGKKISKKINKNFTLPNCKVRIEFLKNPPTEINNNSDEKSRIQSDDYLNKVVDVTKLIEQLMSSKVVLTKLKEPSTLKHPVTRAISVHKNIDLDDDEEEEEEEVEEEEEEEEKDVASETASVEYAHRYCDNCKKIKFARVKDPAWKNCSDCNIKMTYLCVKCNVKRYKRYPFLKLHLERCDGNGDVAETIELNVADENKLVLDKNLFIVKQMVYAPTTKKYARYCQHCKLTLEYYSEKSNKCDHCKKDVHFMCTKCKKKYTSHSGLRSHVSTQCYYKNQYKCTKCKYSTTCWNNMVDHFTYHHSDRPLFKCEFCSHETRVRYTLIRHIRNVHLKFSKQFNCDICSYSTNFHVNLRRHKQSKH